MLMPTCLKPYPGELLYGWIVRLFRVNMYDSLEKFSVAYIPYEDRKYKMKRPVPVRLDYRFNLDHICAENEEFECFPDVRTMISEMTPLVTQFPFMTRGLQAKNLEILLRERTGGKLDIPLMEKDITELHVCPDCVREDIAAYEIPYLHTVHHLPGVRMCPKHHRVLMRVQVEPDDWERGLDDGSTIPMELRADESIEKKISDFVQGLYDSPPALDLIGLRSVVLGRMRQLGYPIEKPYGSLAGDICSAGYGNLFDSEPWVCVNKFLSRKQVILDDGIALLAFLFRDYEDFQEEVAKIPTENESDLSELFPEYIIHSYDNWIVELECKKCSEKFHIHPYALYLGIGCPKCDRAMDPDEVFQHQLRMIGDGAYTLKESFPGYTKMVKIRHETCGKERSVKTSSLIWMEKRCNCERFLTHQEIQERINRANQTEERYTLIKYHANKEQKVTIRHEGCGAVFTLGLREFERAPFCRCCGKGKVIYNDFEQRFQELMGNEYDMVTPYQGVAKMMKVRHRTCGTVTEGYARSFLRGKRCALCTSIIQKKDLIEYMDECTGGEYHVSDIERDTITICGPDGNKLTNTVQYFLQELSLGTQSSIFNHVVKTPKIPLRDAAVVYFMAKSVCEKWSVWMPKEVDCDMDSEKIKCLARQLVRNGYLFRKCPGVYCIDPNTSDETLIRELYLERQGNRIGVYYDESAAYHAGILQQKPEVEYILCDNVKETGFRTKRIGTTEIKVRAAYTEINNRNYRAIEGINLLMFSGRHPEYKHRVEDWLLENRIFISDMEPYFQYYPDAIKKIVKGLFK